MSEQLTLKTNNSPSYFNKDTLLGGLLSYVVGGIVLNAFIPGGGLIAAAGGAIIGGMMGKNRIEDENKNGKKVGEPTAWNKDTAIGGLLGFVGAGIAVAVTLVLGAGATLAAAAAAPAAVPAAAIGTLVAMGAALLGAPIVGAFIGGKIGKNRQTHEVEDSKKQTIVEHLSKTVSPEVGKAVEYSMEHGKDWSKQVTEERMLAEAQQQHR